MALKSGSFSKDVAKYFINHLMWIVICSTSVEAEAHIDLLAKLVPKWISVIQIKRGKFIKIDKNRDTKSVIEKINSANKT